MEEKMKEFAGLDSSNLVNTLEIGNALQHIICVCCLRIASAPLQCSLCDTILCEGCLFKIRSVSKMCFQNCPGKYGRANKYLREIFSLCKFGCRTCRKEFLYNDYIIHLYTCNPKTISQTKIIKNIQKKDQEIEQLKKHMSQLQKEWKFFIKAYYYKLVDLNDDQLRKFFLTFNLPVSKKAELYRSSTQSKPEEFKKLIEIKKYPILEEISTEKYYWTTLHYAMHYGQLEIIEYILNSFQEDGILPLVMKLKTSDGRCPILCLLKSNYLSEEEKKKVFEKLLTLYGPLEFMPSVQKEVKLRKFSSILNKIKTN